MPRALAPEERQRALAILNAEQFADLPPAEGYATLLDEGQYVCSIRTLYRILQAHGAGKARRRHLQHPPSQAPELLATGPNPRWAGDITQLRGPVKWPDVSLDVILDVFSRSGVGWLAARQESAPWAQRLIAQTCDRQGVERGALTIHADRGPAMLAQSVALRLADLGVTTTHGRPHVSHDNPYSESQVKTLQYPPHSQAGSGRCRMPGASCWTASRGTSPSPITAAWAG